MTNVYRYDGQAGAAAITLEDQSAASQTELSTKLYSELKAKGVPSYAFPRLVRFIEKYVLICSVSFLSSHKSNSSRVSTGVTFKQAKGDLIKKGWSPEIGIGSDALYWLNGKQYEKLEPSNWTEIEAGRAKI